MTNKQRDRAIVLHHAKSLQWVAKAAITLGSTVPMSEVSDKIDKLVCAVKSLNTKSVECSQLTDHMSGSH